MESFSADYVSLLIALSRFPAIWAVVTSRGCAGVIGKASGLQSAQVLSEDGFEKLLVALLQLKERNQKIKSSRKMNVLNVSLMLLFSASTLGGCASITRGSTNEVSFQSTPNGAKVVTSTGQSCTTPCEMIFDRREEFIATFVHDDFADEKRIVAVTTDIAANGVGATAGNILAGGVIGVGIDVATGAGLDHFPDPVMADFTKPQDEALLPKPKPEVPEEDRPGRIKPTT